MPIPRPPKGVRWLIAQAPTLDILIAVFASAVGFSSADNYHLQGRMALSIMTSFGTIGVVGFTIGKQVMNLRAARRRASTHELEGCLHTLREVLMPEEDARLRLAIHVPVDETFEQVTDYVGDTPKPGRVGRRFPINSGIIGSAYRAKNAFVGRRVSDDYEGYINELIDEWNFTEGRARKLNPGAMEWMASPFYDTERQRVDAVLFLEANQRGFFTPSRQELVLAALDGMAAFVAKRYADQRV